MEAKNQIVHYEIIDLPEDEKQKQPGKDPHPTGFECSVMKIAVLVLLVVLAGAAISIGVLEASDNIIRGMPYWIIGGLLLTITVFVVILAHRRCKTEGDFEEFTELNSIQIA